MPPVMPGTAVSQNSWDWLKPKPTSFRLVAVMLQTCQTTKATSRAGTAIHRLRVATLLPVERQKAGSSGDHCVMVRPGRYCAGSAIVSCLCTSCVASCVTSCVAELMAWS
ncbi:hypothetical protein AB0O22_09780 [Streptomyces sp. NPDC091204]|uniref:hypothetical protein n=1 Tax=Streptomyces sp. NPDC091204 TaxID=3155299 RepID=UPI003447920F